MNYLTGTCSLNPITIVRNGCFLRPEMLRVKLIRVFSYELSLGKGYPGPILWVQNSDLCVWSLSQRLAIATI